MEILKRSVMARGWGGVTRLTQRIPRAEKQSILCDSVGFGARRVCPNPYNVQYQVQTLV